MDVLDSRIDAQLRVSGMCKGQHLATDAGESVYELEQLGTGDELLGRDAMQSRRLVARDGHDRWVCVPATEGQQVAGGNTLVALEEQEDGAS